MLLSIIQIALLPFTSASAWISLMAQYEGSWLLFMYWHWVRDEVSYVGSSLASGLE